ncbi:MAG: GNAT family N-acetyltransferase [Candidatus Marinimicrobia bacterium]|jgi:RimJ/RimL family protein N-acetyltransferase|nr:GNAT family N-acetyltransferase [Candidatus Neomarinimicrobiota bacterium]
MKNILETDRLLLREISKDDYEGLFQLHSDPIVQKYTGEPPVKTISEIINGTKERTFKDYKTHGFGRWAVIVKSTDQFTGWAGLKYLPEFDEIDLGYRFLPEFWGKGIATEASKAIIKYGFEILKIEKIIAVAMVGNTASIKVMEKAGMIFDKKAPYEEGAEDDIWYKIEKKYYNNTKPV